MSTHCFSTDMQPCTRRACPLCSRVMDHPADNAPPPSPHARFPWAPALLCAASLAMAGWTWMRFSYAWDATPESLLAAIPPVRVEIATGPMGRRPVHTYPGYPDSRRLVSLTGTVILEAPEGLTYPGKRTLATAGEAGGIVWLIVPREMPLDLDIGMRLSSVARVGSGVIERQKPLPSGDGDYLFSGKMIATVYLDPTASRFTGASVAGLVVAAFGTFVFVLYLRRWMKERGRKSEAGA